MSSAIAFFSSSRRSTRSTNAFRCSFAKRAAGCSCSFLTAAAMDIETSSDSSSSSDRRLWERRGQARRQMIPAVHRSSVLVARFLQCSLLLLRRLRLVLGLPLLVRHAVDQLPTLVLGQRHATFVGGILHPIGQAVAAEAGQVHQINVL